MHSIRIEPLRLTYFFQLANSDFTGNVKLAALLLEKDYLIGHSRL